MNSELNIFNSSITLQQPHGETTVSIPLMPKLDLSDWEKVTLLHVVNDVNKQAADVLVASKNNPELILRVITEFQDIAQNARFIPASKKL